VQNLLSCNLTVALLRGRDTIPPAAQILRPPCCERLHIDSGLASQLPVGLVWGRMVQAALSHQGGPNVLTCGQRRKWSKRANSAHIVGRDGFVWSKLFKSIVAILQVQHENAQREKL
jgi:hypothetical protein